MADAWRAHNGAPALLRIAHRNDRPVPVGFFDVSFSRLGRRMAGQAGARASRRCAPVSRASRHAASNCRTEKLRRRRSPPFLSRSRVRERERVTVLPLAPLTLALFPAGGEGKGKRWQGCAACSVAVRERKSGGERNKRAGGNKAKPRGAAPSPAGAGCLTALGRLKAAVGL